MGFRSIRLLTVGTRTAKLNAGLPMNIDTKRGDLCLHSSNMTVSSPWDLPGIDCHCRPSLASSFASTSTPTTPSGWQV